MHKMVGIRRALFVVILFCPLANCDVLTPGSLKVKVGKDVVFKWNTTNGIEVAMFGFKDPSSGGFATRLMYTDDTPREIIDNTPFKGRVSFVGDLTAGHAWFKITNLNVSDGKKYDAKIREVGQSYKWSSVDLEVTVPPEFTLDKPPSSKTIKEGDDLSIQCSAKGPPTPQVKWLHNGNISSQGQGSATLNIEKIKRSQSGTYECQASNNPNEQPAKTTTKVTVYYTSKINQTSGKEFACVGDVATLVCHADGNPQPTITWYHQGAIVNKPQSSNELKFNNVKDEDFGNYTCTATNVVGSDSIVVQLVKTNVTCTPPTTTQPTQSTSTSVHPGIIAGVVIVGLLAIAGLVIAIIFCCRRKLLIKDSRLRDKRVTVQMSAVNAEEEQYAIAQRTSRVSAVEEEPVAQYAVVDKSKKTKKKTPGEGELIYADLDHDALGERPPSDRRPSGGSNEPGTLYADIGGTKHQEPPRYGNLQNMDHM